jgi:hypothetical protein
MVRGRPRVRAPVCFPPGDLFGSRLRRLHCPVRFFKVLVIGPPQLWALLLLACFAALCVRVIGRAPLSPAEQDHIMSGRQVLELHAIPRRSLHTPLVNLAAAAALQWDASREPHPNRTTSALHREVIRLRWIVRAPFVLFGLLLGGSIWYVARRLYGNAGGYIALALYGFSPAMVLHATTVDEALPSAFGIFGVVFVAIALSHNLYAPWRKWRYRTLLLAVAMAVGVASHPAAVLAVPFALAFMLYLAPGRRWLAVFLTLLAVTLAFALVYCAYDFQPRALLNGLDLREWLRYTPAEARAALFQPQVFTPRFPPVLLGLLAVSALTYLGWGRTRYFGNTAPLLCGVATLYLALVTPLASAAALWALPFLFVFVGGIWADLLESRRGSWVLIALIALMVEYAWLGCTLSAAR